jgi:DNA-binding IclR family transcriptional regulator
MMSSRAARSTYAPGLERNQSLGRAVTLLRGLAERPGGSSAMDLSRSTDLPRPTVGRLLATLSDAGLAQTLPDGQWVLGPELVRLARAADPHLALIERARPHVARLAATVGESAMLGVTRAPGAGEVILQVDAPNLLAPVSWLGRGFPAHASAGQKLALARLSEAELREWLADHPLERLARRTITTREELLAELDRVRRSGYAETVDELEDGLSGIAVPVDSPEPDTTIALAVSGPSSRLDGARRAEIAEIARDHARRLGAAIR